jgi:hypothetical protein
MKKRAGASDRELALLEEEIESLRRKRPPSLRMNVASGKKERDPQYHCLMEQVRRRTMKYSISRLRGALTKGPQRYSLQTVLEGALKEIAVLKKKEDVQKEQMLSLAEKKEKLKQRLRELGSDDNDSAIYSERSSPELDHDDLTDTKSPQPTFVVYEKSSSPMSTTSSDSMQSLSSMSSTATVAPVPLAMPALYPPVMLRTSPVNQQQFPNLVMYPFLSRVPVVSPTFNPMSAFCRVVPQNHFFPTLISTVKQTN